MKITNPFTGVTHYFGKSEVKQVKESLSYGQWQNTFQDMISFGGYRISFQTLYTIYNNVVDVKQSVRKLQNAVMKAGYILVSAKDEEVAASDQEYATFQAYMDKRELTLSTLIDLWVRDQSVAGNAYWLVQKSVDGKIMGIKPVDPRTMTVVVDKYGNKKGYVQRVGGNTIHFELDEIIHSVMDFSTSHPCLGVSPIESIVWASRTEMASQMSNYYFYENNGVPSHLLILQEDVSPEQMKKLKKEMEKSYGGAKNKWKSGIIPFIKDIKTVTPSQKDMQYLETRALTTDKIVVAFGVDKFILGYTEKVQRGNADVIYKNFYENTVRSWEVYLEEVINNHLLPALGLDGVKFRINESNYKNEREVAEISRLDVTAGIMTVNEARRLRGLDPLDNELADELLFNGFPIDDLGDEVGQLKATWNAKQQAKMADLYNLLEV